MHAQRIMAIFEKDLKDFMKNMMLLVMPFIPIVLALLYSAQISSAPDDEMPELMIYIFVYIIVGATFAGCTSSVIMTMMAEEKEKKTLRGLMLSPASFMDIIIGKSLVTALMSFISLAISLWIVSFNPFTDIRIVISIILLFAFFLLLGISVGLIVKTVSVTSAYLLPILFIFGFTPMVILLGLSQDSIILKIAKVFPIMQGIKIHETSSWLPVGIIFIWMIAAGLLTYLIFRREMTDD